jgi:hypothetical protein
MRPACFQANPNLAKSSQIRPSPSKENQRKRLGFPCISLAVLSLFNGLRRPPGAKRILLVSWVAEACALEATPSTRSIVQSIFVPAAPGNRNKVTINPDFLQSIVFIA